ncbi:MAG: hypothetical protein HXY51_07660 [Nitrospirae bacterium]|nr:hypothetical protein [Nitrospirota bacterium]
MNGPGYSIKQWPGQSYPLGATWDGKGVNFAIFSEHATDVELCLFNSPEAEKESARVRFTEYTDQVWHAYLPEVLPGQLYGYRASQLPTKIFWESSCEGCGVSSRNSMGLVDRTVY